MGFILPGGFWQNWPVEEKEECWNGCHDDDDSPVSLPERQNGSQNFAQIEENFDDDAAQNALFSRNHFHRQNEGDKK